MRLLKTNFKVEQQKVRKIKNIRDLHREQDRVKEEVKELESNWLTSFLTPKDLFTLAKKIRTVRSAKKKKKKKQKIAAKKIVKKGKKEEKKRTKKAKKRKIKELKKALKDKTLLPSERQKKEDLLQKEDNTFKKIGKKALIAQGVSLGLFLGTVIFLKIRKQKERDTNLLNS